MGDRVGEDPELKHLAWVVENLQEEMIKASAARLAADQEVVRLRREVDLLQVLPNLADVILLHVIHTATPVELIASTRPCNCCRKANHLLGHMHAGAVHVLCDAMHSICLRHCKPQCKALPEVQLEGMGNLTDMCSA